MSKVEASEANSNQELYDYIKEQVKALSEQVNSQTAQTEKKISALRREADLGNLQQRLQDKAERTDVEGAIAAQDTRLEATE